MIREETFCVIFTQTPNPSLFPLTVCHFTRIACVVVYHHHHMHIASSRNNAMSATPTKRPTGRTKNMLGPQIRRLRYARGWSQATLAIQLQLNGLDVSREVLAQMECQLHCIRDKHIFHLARALEVKASDLFVGFEK
jgi:ribosome-binding protein aMBF1 (putative translation factor)